MSHNVTVERHVDLSSFIPAAVAFLDGATEYNLLSNMILKANEGEEKHGPRFKDPIGFLLRGPDGGVVGLAFRTSPHSSLVLSLMPGDASLALAQYFLDEGMEWLPIAGPLGVARSIAGGMSGTLKVNVEMSFNAAVPSNAEKFPLLVPANGAEVRWSNKADAENLYKGVVAFSEELEKDGHAPPLEVVSRKATEGEYAVLMLSSGELAAFAGAVNRDMEKRSIRIGPVFTFRNHRRNQYALALIRWICRDLWERGVTPTLFIDVNSKDDTTGLYRKAAGFVPVWGEFVDGEVTLTKRNSEQVYSDE